MELVSVFDRKPKFMEKVKIYSPLRSCLIDGVVEKNPFSNNDPDYYWMIKSPVDSEYTWSLILDSDLYQPERSKREDFEEHERRMEKRNIELKPAE